MLYRYLIELGVAKEMPLFGHMPYVMGRGNKKLSKRDPESNLFLHRDNGFIREGLLNYRRCWAGPSPPTATCSPWTR